MIENYPGYPEIDGFDLMMKFREQVERYEVPIMDEDIVSIERDGHSFRSTTSRGTAYDSSTVILAVGRERRKLGLEHEEEWVGKGVSFCSTCDAPLHRGNVVAVVGGGSAAVEGAILISKYAEKVYLIYRGDKFTRPEPVNVRRLDETANIEQVLRTNVIELKGEDGLESIVLDRPHNGASELAVDGLFIEIGADPRVELATSLGAALNDLDEVIVDKHMRTSVHGVFAAGDLDGRVGRPEADGHGCRSGCDRGHLGLRGLVRAPECLQVARKGAAGGLRSAGGPPGRGTVTHRDRHTYHPQAARPGTLPTTCRYNVRSGATRPSHTEWRGTSC